MYVSLTLTHRGRLAQLVERTLSMREVGGSKPPMSSYLLHKHHHCLYMHVKIFP